MRLKLGDLYHAYTTQVTAATTTTAAITTDTTSTTHANTTDTDTNTITTLPTQRSLIELGDASKKLAPY